MTFDTNPMKSAFIYTRYSSDKQNKTSNEDQLGNCRTYAAANNLNVVAVFADAETSGKTLHRPGFLQMVEALKKQKPEVVLVDDLSRLSRNATDQGIFLRSLDFQDIGLIAVSEGIDSREKAHKYTSAFKGVLNELYLDNLRMHTRRGQEGAVSRGNVAGGKSYGYDHMAVSSGVQRTINQGQAAVIRRIFEMFADGMSPLKIAETLNEEGVPSPTGRQWHRSAIHGDPKDLSGILNNPLYEGKVYWNRLSYKTNPDTGKRVSKRNPPEEWAVMEMPDLRIVSEQLWGKVKARQLVISHRSTEKMKVSGLKARTGAGSKYLLSGLLKCQECGSNFVLVNSKSYGCASRKECGPASCNNSLLIKKQAAETFLLDAVACAATPKKLEVAVLERFKAIAIERFKSQKSLLGVSPDDKLLKAKKETENIIESIKKGCPAELFVSELQRLKLEQEKLQAELDCKPTLKNPEQDLKQAVNKAVQMLPKMTANFSKVLSDNPVLAKRMLDTLFGGKIEVFTTEQGKVGLKSKVFLESYFRSALLLPEFSNSREINVVAGAGFEPTTFGL